MAGTTFLAPNMDENISAFGSAILAATGTTTGLMTGATGTTGSAKNGCSRSKRRMNQQRANQGGQWTLSVRGAGGGGGVGF